LDAKRALVHIVMDPWVGRTPAGPEEYAVTVRLAASEVAALGTSPTRVTYVGRDTGSALARREHTPRLGLQTIPPQQTAQLDASWHLVDLRSDNQASTKELLLGDGTFQACIGLDLVAVQQHGEAWTIHGAPGASVQLTPPASATVVGVWRSGTGSSP